MRGTSGLQHQLATDVAAIICMLPIPQRLHDQRCASGGVACVQTLSGVLHPS